MKISASVFAQSHKSFLEIAEDMDKIGVYYLHIDCKSEATLTSFLVIQKDYTKLPLDFHFIHPEIPLYTDQLSSHPENRFCIQYEELSNIPPHFFDYKLKKGIAIKTATQIAVLTDELVAKIDFVMLMCTVPGESGGAFDIANFQRIHQLKKKHPSLKITIDGGVDSDVAFVLRLLGVDTVVSGSYLMKQNEYAINLLSILHPFPTDTFKVVDFMLPLADCPVLIADTFSFKKCVESIDSGGFGFVLVVNKSGALEGIVTNADIRKVLLRNWNSLESIQLSEYLNTQPGLTQTGAGIRQMLKTIEEARRVILFLPVVDENNLLQGVVPLNNLAKG